MEANHLRRADLHSQHTETIARRMLEMKEAEQRGVVRVLYAIEEEDPGAATTTATRSVVA